MNRLNDKTALITGGGSGLGQGMTELFAAEGARVAILEIRPDWAKETEALLLQKGHKLLTLVGDVRNEAGVRGAVDRCLAEFGRLDILVNNAGVTAEMSSPLTDLPLEEWDRVMDVNLRGPLLCIRAAAGALRKAGGGSIINVTSVSARSCYPGRGAYSVSKAGLEALTRQTAIELAPWKIRVNSMSLGWFRTPFNEFVYKAPGELERRNATIPIGRIGTVDDAAKLALFLASDDSSYVTGESIESDGGLAVAGLISAAELARIRPTP